jgi:hypothetical protein
MKDRNSDDLQDDLSQEDNNENAPLTIGFVKYVSLMVK